MTDEPLRAAHAVAGAIALSDRPGRAMREARTRYGFTQGWLAPHLGVRRESLSRIESGHSTPTLDVVARFARLMGLAQVARDTAARLERQGGRPSVAVLRSLAGDLGLEPETVDAVVRAALASYAAKREALLDGLR